MLGDWRGADLTAAEASLFLFPLQTLTGKEIEIDIEPTDKVLALNPQGEGLGFLSFGACGRSPSCGPHLTCVVGHNSLGARVGFQGIQPASWWTTVLQRMGGAV